MLWFIVALALVAVPLVLAVTVLARRQPPDRDIEVGPAAQDQTPSTPEAARRAQERARRSGPRPPP